MSESRMRAPGLPFGVDARGPRRVQYYCNFAENSGEIAMKQMRTIRIAVAVMAFGAVLLGASSRAFAADDKEGYGYSFDDDPLSAGGFGPNDATIRVRPRAARTTLIRPRTSFVPEMLKSVESL